MKILEFRHLGMPVNDLESSMAFFEEHGFSTVETGSDIISGTEMKWVKMSNDLGFVIELITGGQYHLAFGVDAIPEDQYVFHTPRGYKVVFDKTPEGMPVEYVESPNKN